VRRPNFRFEDVGVLSLRGEHGHDHDPLPEHRTSDFNLQVFFGRTYCPHWRVKHERFAKNGWVCEPDTAALDLQHNGGVMDRTISRLNIEHYRRKLATERDETTRQTLMRLLAEEQAKLAALDYPLERKQPGA
jgi:hypothetical protein